MSSNMSLIDLKKLNRNSSEKFLYCLLLAIVGVWFFLLNLNTPFMHDDLAYHYYYDDNSAIERPTSEPISSFLQLFPSMWNHYNAVNGRYTSHFLIQLFCGLIGKGVFNYLNTVIFLIFLDLLVILSYGARKILPLCLSVFSVVFFLPFPGQTMLWLTGSINYLWSATFSLMVLKIVVGPINKGFLLCFLSFFFGLFSGWMNESITFGIGGGMVVYSFLNRDRFKGTTRWTVVGYIIGCVMILLAPGTFNRAASGELNRDMNILQMFTSRVFSSLIVMKSHPIITIALILVILTSFRGLRFLLRDSYILIYSFILSGLFCFLVGLTESRVFFGLSVLGTIILILAIRSLSQSVELSRSVRYIVSVILLVLCVFPEINAYNRTKGYIQYSREVENNIIISPSACVIEAIPFNSSRFVYATRVYANRYQLHNKVRSYYYHKDYVCAIPKQLLFSYESQDTSVIPDDNWIIKLDSGATEVTRISTHTIPDPNLNNRQRIIRYLLGTLNINGVIPDYAVLEYNSESLLIVPQQKNVDKLYITFKNKDTIEVPCVQSK